MDIDTRDKNAVAIDKWCNITNIITENWIYEVFEIEDKEEIDYFWVGDEPSGVFSFADYFFDFQNILDYYKHNITKENLFEWYDFCLENQKVNISLAKFIMSPQEKKEAEEKHLEELKERVNSAKKELEKQLNKYKIK